MSKYKNLRQFLRNSYDVGDVQTGCRYWVTYLLSKCSTLFEYEGLPDTLPAWEIEKSLIVKGAGAVVRAKKDGKIYAPFEGNVYNNISPYLYPTKFIFSNPFLGSATYEDGKNCAIIYNQPIDKNACNTSAMWETIARYSRMLADLESTFYSLIIAQRAGRLGSAISENVAIAMDQAMTTLEAGQTKTIVNGAGLLEGFKPLNFMPTGSVIEFTTTRDYLLNCFFEDIGIHTLEEKKERLVSIEVSGGGQVLTNNIEILYKTRQENCKKINDVFGLNISVKPSEALKVTEPAPEDFNTYEEEEEDHDSDRIL